MNIIITHTDNYLILLCYLISLLSFLYVAALFHRIYNKYKQVKYHNAVHATKDKMGKWKVGR